MENGRATQRNNGNDWHKDRNKTQQHRWHFVCFQPERRGSLPHTKAYWKGVCPKKRCQDLVRLGSSWLKDLKRGVTELNFTDLQKGGPMIRECLLRKHSQGCGSGWTGKFRIKDLLKDLKESWTVKNSGKHWAEQTKKVKGSKFLKNTHTKEERKQESKGGGSQTSPSEFQSLHKLWKQQSPALLTLDKNTSVPFQCPAQGCDTSGSPQVTTVIPDIAVQGSSKN